MSSIRSTLTSNSNSSSSSTPNTSTNPTSSISHIFNQGRRLRQRSEKNYAENPRRSSVSSSTPLNQHNIAQNVSNFNLPGSSPMKTDLSFTELQSSLFMYFGAANRISSGEKFSVRGRRQCSDGRYQYLVEWEGMS